MVQTNTKKSRKPNKKLFRPIMSEEDVFIKKMQGVVPIKSTHKLEKGIKKTLKELNKTTSQKKQIKITQKKTPSQIATNFKYESHNINKNLRKGRVKINKKIDFHGRTLLVAEEIFVETIKKSYHNNERCILFVTGKGLNPNKTNSDILESHPKLFYGKIRDSLKQWVEKQEMAKYILAVERASPEHGGDGAFYVYLRKRKN